MIAVAQDNAVSSVHFPIAAWADAEQPGSDLLSPDSGSLGRLGLRLLVALGAVVALLWVGLA